MSDRIPCSQYESDKKQCLSGWPSTSSICWGGLIGCPTCGANGKPPPCLDENPPAHYLRADGKPRFWPESKPEGDKP